MCLIIWGISFLQLTRRPLWERNPSKKSAGDILRALRASTRAPGEDHIFTAGEKEWNVWCERKDSGVPINDAVQKELCTVRDQLGLTQYTFPWEK